MSTEPVEVYYKGEDEANCASCLAEWVLGHLFKREPKPHLTRFLAVVDDTYLCEKHYRKYLVQKAVREATTK